MGQILHALFSTDIFCVSLVEATLEERDKGEKLNNITPFWRVVSNDSARAKKHYVDTEELYILTNIKSALTLEFLKTIYKHNHCKDKMPYPASSSFGLADLFLGASSRMSASPLP